MFQFPKPFPLTKRLKDVLESEVDEKYFLSDKMLNYFDSRASNFNNGNINFKDGESVGSTITSSSKSLNISNIIDEIVEESNNNSLKKIKHINFSKIIYKKKAFRLNERLFK